MRHQIHTAHCTACRMDSEQESIMQIYITMLILIALTSSSFCSDTHTVKAGPSHTDIPETRPFSESLLNQLKLPRGFRIQVFASHICGARMLATAADGTIFVTCPDEGKVVALKDTSGDGKADVIKDAISGLDGVHGIVLLNDTVFLASTTTIRVAEINGYTITNQKVIIDDLPTDGRHPKRTLGIGPDHKLYISIGSSCNACIETDSNYATIECADLDGKNRTVFCRGLRNTLGFDWRTSTKQLWGMDQGSDERGDTIPPEELNLLQEGKNYGWPFVFGKRVKDPLLKVPHDFGMTEKEFVESTEPAVLTYSAHNSPIGFIFYKASMFPKHYRNGAFITFRGSWNRKPPSGYKLVFVRFENGKPVGFEDFITGFLIENGRAQFGRVTGITVAKDGALIFCDDNNGMIYRVSY